MINQQHETNYTWVPARISPEVYDKIDSIARVLDVRRHEVVSASIRAGLSISPYELALTKVMTDRRVKVA